MKKQKKFMSSKQIYFLPIINKHYSGQLRRSFDIQNSPGKPKSIEQIMHDKSISQKPKHNVSLEVLKRPKASTKQNLYNKYELLPKIMTKKLKRKHKIKQNSDTQNINKHQQQDKQTQQAKIQKENPVNFSLSFYQRQFKQLLASQTDKIPFQLSNSYSTHNLLMSQKIQDQPLVHLANLHRKYTKIHITQPQQSSPGELQKVPDYLLRLIEPNRK